MNDFNGGCWSEDGLKKKNTRLLIVLSVHWRRLFFLLYLVACHIRQSYDEAGLIKKKKNSEILQQRTLIINIYETISVK